MSTDVAVVIIRETKAKHDSEVDTTVASVWLVFYLIMIVGTLAGPGFARAINFATLY